MSILIKNTQNPHAYEPSKKMNPCSLIYAYFGHLKTNKDNISYDPPAT